VAAAGRLAILELEEMAGRVAVQLAGMESLGLEEEAAAVGPHMLLMPGRLLAAAAAGLACSGLARLGLAEQEQRHLLLGLQEMPMAGVAVLAVTLG
jgi:hypothetical protein